MRLVQNWGVFPKIGIYQRLPISKYNQILKLCLHQNIESQLYYDGIGYSTTIQDKQLAIQTLLKGFNPKEFNQAINGIHFEQDTLKWDHKKRIENDVHSLAFQNSIYHDISKVTQEDVQKYADKYLFSDNAVISAVGHSINKEDLPIGNATTPDVISRYFGGYNKIKTQKPPTLSPLSELSLNYFALYFPVSGICSSDMFTFAVLCQILGGGSAFSAGGPGKGIYSRLYQVLCHSNGIESIFVNLYQFEKISLFGITMGAEYNLNKQAFSILLNQLMKLYEIDDVELERAKFQTLSTQFQNLEKTGNRVEFMGRSILHCNKVYSMEEIEARIMQVGKSAIQTAISSMLQAPPTACVAGEDMRVEDPHKLCQRVGIPTVTS